MPLRFLSLLSLAVVVTVGVQSNASAEEESPFADLYNVLGTTESLHIRGRVVLEEGPVDCKVTVPWDEISQEEVSLSQVSFQLLDAQGKLVVDLGTHPTDEGGYLDHVLPLPAAAAPPGAYTLTATLDQKQIGSASVRLVEANSCGLLVRSDIDKTYIATRFISSSDKLKLLYKNASERIILEGMPQIYRGLRKGRSGEDNCPLTFLSGSPAFFKRTLEARMEMDAIEQDGLALKPFKEMASRKIFQRKPGDLHSALKAQIGYKLTWLLELRLDAPPCASELLLGDDSEADFAVYALYHQLTSRQISLKELQKKLRELGVSLEWRIKVQKLGKKVLATLQNPAPVKGIYINKTGKSALKHRIEDWMIPGLTCHHDGSWPLALDLWEEGWIGEDALLEVRRSMVEAGVGSEELQEAAKAALGSKYLRPETVQRFHADPAP